ncbi:LysE family translocator [Thalassotalea montiporae]
MSMLVSMAVFSLSMSISPGPVNFVALTSGLNFGFLNSLKFVVGATVGFIALLFLIGIGLGAAIEGFPLLMATLKYVGCGYFIYIGYKVFTDTGGISETNDCSSIPSFSQGWLMQWFNPKAWMACLAGCAAFDVYTSELRLFQFLTIYFVICFIGIGGWALMGKKIKSWLVSVSHMQLFNRVMGGTLCILGVGLLFD